MDNMTVKNCYLIVSKLGTHEQPMWSTQSLQDRFWRPWVVELALNSTSHMNSSSRRHGCWNPLSTSGVKLISLIQRKVCSFPRFFVFNVNHPIEFDPGINAVPGHVKNLYASRERLLTAMPFFPTLHDMGMTLLLLPRWSSGFLCDCLAQVSVDPGSNNIEWVQALIE